MLTVVLSIACIIFAMLTVVLLTACLIFAIGWLKNKIGLLTLTAYITQKGYAPPPDEETQACTEYTIKNLFRKEKSI